MEYRKFFLNLLYVLAAIAALWLFAAVLLPLGLPFFLAFLLAVLAEPATEYLIRRRHLPRWLAGTVCTVGIYGVIAAVLYLLLRVVFRELGDFLAQMPTLLEGLMPTLAGIEEKLVNAAGKLPDGLGDALEDSVTTFFQNGAGLLEQLPGKALSFLSDAAQALPRAVMFLITTMVASFLTAAQLPRLRRWLNHVLPAKWRRWVTVTWQRLRSTAGGWMKAQGKLIAVTFAIVTLGLLILRVPYALLLGLVIALVDALPILGTGTILIPWALVMFLRGETGRGIAFLLLYGIAALTRTSLEPRLLGKQMGLNPLLTLGAVYVGYRLCGIGGMILFPVGAALAVQLHNLFRPPS